MEKYKDKIITLLLIVCSICQVACFVYYLYLGERIVVNPHDQLDLEIPNFILKSRDISTLFEESFPQFMCGRTDVETTSVIGTLLYVIFSPVYAFIVNIFLVRIIAFLGMYLLLVSLKTNRICSIITSFVFSFIPFYSVYGLNIMGIPMLVYAFVSLYKQKKCIYSYIYILIQGLYSSIVLSGFYIVPLLCLSIIILLVKKKEVIGVVVGTIELVIFYCISNINLLVSLFSDDSFISHRTEFVSEETSFGQSFHEMFFYGQYHAISLHQYFVKYIIILSIILIVLGILHKNISNIRIIIILWLFIVGIACFYAFMNCSVGIKTKDIIFGDSYFKSFQFERIYWSYPFLWYFLCGLVISSFSNYIFNNKLYARMVKNFWEHYEGEKKWIVKCFNRVWLKNIFVVVLCYSFFVRVFYSSDCFQNLFADDNSITWGRFYETDIFDRIDLTINMDKDNFRVLSIGLYPSIALYNGYYCIDGYSQNYDIEYKHLMYRLQEEELSENSQIYDYFCNWGSRCYVFSSELSQNYYVNKNSQFEVSVNLDSSVLKELDCKYIFSAVPLKDMGDVSVECKGYFDDEDSLYGVYLYEIK